VFYLQIEVIDLQRTRRVAPLHCGSAVNSPSGLCERCASGGSTAPQTLSEGGSTCMLKEEEEVEGGRKGGR